LDEVLEANRCSGFWFPLACHSPYYGLGRAQPDLPSEVAYAELIARVYQQYPHYDEEFFPVNELARLSNSGAWNLAQNLPLRVQLLLGFGIGVRVFRQIPALSRIWREHADLGALPPEQLLPDLMRFIRTQYEWSRNTFCGRCEWRYLCGGLDPASGNEQLRPGMLEVACEYRKLFLETFVCQIANDKLSTSQGRQSIAETIQDPVESGLVS
jgi:hypothetical protein